MNANNDKKTPRARVLLIYLCGIMSALNVGKMPTSLPALQTDFTMSLVAAGTAVSAFNIIAALFGFATGVLTDRLGARRMIILGLIATLAGDFTGSVAPNTAVFIASRTFEGVGFAFLIVAAPALLAAQASTRDARSVLGVWGAFMPVGMTLSLLLAPLMLDAVGWRGFWRLLGLTTLIVLGAFALTIPAAPRPVASTRGFEGIRRVLKTPSIIFIGAGFGAFSFAYLSLLAFIPVWLIQTRGVSLAFAAAVAAAFAAVSVPGNFLSAWLFHRGWPPRRLALIGAAGLTLMPFLVFPPGLPLWGSVLALMMFSAFSGLIPSSAFALVLAHAPAPALVGSSNGLVMQILNTGSWLGPPAFAAVVSASGWGAAPIALSLAALASAGFFFTVSSGRAPSVDR